ncbi:MAG: glucose-1-phosphate adenylyltransferase subunit GlgD [Oscillospiraceae bacterium]
MRANDVLGIIYSHAYDESIPELTNVRTMASVPFGCRYRLIDFPLSNMVNSGITEVGIITKSHYQSLMDHVGTGKPWDLSRKREGMFILPPFNNASPYGNHDNRIQSLVSILDFLRHARHEYVVLTDANAIYNFDFGDLFKFHTKSESDITIVYKHGKKPRLDNVMVLNMTDNNRVDDISLSPHGNEEVDYSLNIILLRKSLLEHLVQGAFCFNHDRFERDIIQENVKNLRVFGYEAPGFSALIDSLKSYYEVNMQLLNPTTRRTLFEPDNQIHTKICDNVPATYSYECNVKNSLIADGCIINGTVENSILFRGVHVSEDAVIRNSIVMQGTIVNRNAKLNCVITDKNVTITPGKSLSGDIAYPIYLGKGITI